jgi:hypothetical protein
MCSVIYFGGLDWRIKGMDRDSKASVLRFFALDHLFTGRLAYVIPTALG